jgi:hypothetical protein
MVIPAPSLTGEGPHREQTEKDHQGDPGTVGVVRVLSLASVGNGTDGRFRVYARRVTFARRVPE